MIALRGACIIVFHAFFSSSALLTAHTAANANRHEPKSVARGATAHTAKGNQPVKSEGAVQYTT